MADLLSNLGTAKVNATQKTNDTGTMDSILEFVPIDGMLLRLLSRNGGPPIYLDLRDANGDPLPQDTEVSITYDRPEFDEPVRISQTLSNISTYNRLTIQQQQNEEYRERTRIPFKDRYEAVGVRDLDRLNIAINSSTQIDWANSSAYVDGVNWTVVSEGN